MRFKLAVFLILMASPLTADTQISGDLQYWIGFKNLLTVGNIQRARAYGQKNNREAFWNVNLIKCNTDYFMASLIPNATEQVALDIWEAQDKAYCYRKQHFVRKDDGSIITETIDLKPLPDDWDKDWSVVEKSTPPK